MSNTQNFDVDDDDEYYSDGYFDDKRMVLGQHIPDYDLTQMPDYEFQEKRLRNRHPNGYSIMEWQDRYTEQRRVQSGEPRPSEDGAHQYSPSRGDVETVDDRQRIDGAATALGLGKVVGAVVGRNDEAEWLVPGMRTPLLNHQVLGVKWMVDREMGQRLPKGGLMADSMGLGKTIQTIATMCMNLPEPLPVHPWGRRIPVVPYVTLVVAPLALLEQWKSEIKRHCDPGMFRVHIHHAPFKLESVTSFYHYEIVLCTYQAILQSFPQQPKRKRISTMTLDQERRFWSKRGVFHRIKFWRVVLDESQYVKNPRGQTSLACQALEAVHTWALSGTPIQNRLEDIYPVIRFLRHPHFSTLKDWRAFIGSASEQDDIQKAKDVENILQEFMLRRTKEDMLLGRKLITLPEKRVGLLEIQLLQEQQMAYDDMEAAAIQSVNGYISDGTVMANALGVLALILRLRQICDHPYLTLVTGNDPINMAKHLAHLQYPVRANSLQDDRIRFVQGSNPREFVHSSKTLAMLEQLEKWKRKYPTDKIVIFSLFTKMIDIIEYIIRNEGWTYRRYQGSMSMDEREDAVDAFRERDQILLVSLMAGGLGVNLTCANRVICMDLWWNPGVELQAFDRVHRIGQTKEVEILRFVTERTIEERLLALQRSKLALAITALDEAGKDEGTLAALRSGQLIEGELVGLLGEMQRNTAGRQVLVAHGADIS